MAHQFDPRMLGARCDECPLGPEGILRKNKKGEITHPWRPVPTEVHHTAVVIAVGETPGPDEEEHGRPFVGKSGLELNRGLEAVGVRRPDVDLANVVACKPPGQASGAWARMEARLSRLNKTAETPIPHPIDCCAPRLWTELADYPYVIALGGVAAKKLTGDARGARSQRGELREVVFPGATRPTKVVPTVHPAYVLRTKAWRAIFQSDLAKAFRFFGDRLNWIAPEATYQPTPNELLAFLKETQPFGVFDIETDGIQPEIAQIRCFGVAIPDLDEYGRCVDIAKRKPHRIARAMGVKLLSGDGLFHYYEPDDERKIIEIMQWWLMSPDYVKVGHNLVFDAEVVRYRWGVPDIRPRVDTVIGARFRAPDLPKGLKPTGRTLTDIGAWDSDEKGDKIVLKVGNTPEEVRKVDQDRCVYCTEGDVTVNARILKPIVEASERAGAFRECDTRLRPAAWPANRPWTLWEIDHETQRMCVEMHRNGIYVDQAVRGGFEKEFEASVVERKRRLLKLVGETGAKVDESALQIVELADDGVFDDIDPSTNLDNPGSDQQIRDLLYGKWGLGRPPLMELRDFLTQTGLPSTGDAVLRAHMANSRLSEAQRAFIGELRLYRRELRKVLGTMLRPLRWGGPLVWADGRVRSTFSAHTTSVGRLSSSRPNMQNQASRKGLGHLRRIFSAAPGHVILGADLAQAHLVVCANYWGIQRLIDCFAQGIDVHNLLAQDVLDDVANELAVLGRRAPRYRDLPGWDEVGGYDLKKKPADGSRALSVRESFKTYRYASIYMATAETRALVMQSTETAPGVLPYLDWNTLKIMRTDATWHRVEPDWKRAWSRMMARYSQQGYMTDPVLGRRSGGLDDGSANDVVNFPVLAAEAAIMRIIENRVRGLFPFEFEGPGTGLILQEHDSLYVECVDRGVEENNRRARQLEEAFRVDVPGWATPFQGEGKWGYNMGELKKPKAWA